MRRLCGYRLCQNIIIIQHVIPSNLHRQGPPPPDISRVSHEFLCFHLLLARLIQTLPAPASGSESCADVTRLLCIYEAYEHTISKDPLSTPHRTLLNHRPPSRASSGSSTNSARGFSSNVKVNDGFEAVDCADGTLDRLGDVGSGGGAECVTVGVMFRNDLNPT